MGKMILLYHTTDDNSHQWVSDGVTRSGTLIEAAKAAGGGNVVLLLSGLDVVLTSVSVPKTSKAKQLKAIPYALEDSLLLNSDAYHFCVEASDKKNEFHIAYIEKLRFSKILADCTKSGLTVSAVYPSVLSLPFYVGVCGVYVDDEFVFIRTGRLQGVVSDKQNASFLMDSMLTEFETRDLMPGFNVYNYSCDEFHLNHNNVTYNDCADDSLIDVLYNAPDHFDLMQGEFSARSKSRLATVWWTLTLLMFMGCLAVSVGTLLHKKNTLSEINDNLTQNISTIYKQHFPRASSVVAPTYRLHQKLSSLESDTIRTDFYSVLETTGSILSSMDDVDIERLAFEDSNLTLTVDAGDIQDVVRLIAQLKNAHLNVAQSNVVNSQSHVTATVRISKGGS